ncbi:O-antigen ligase family protein [Thioalkalivibrio sp.]|uniref:O-antigen ligase family protein n=1 Tax=Thioalkalivibrio sp. TaxID=2093813 RepID=UPI0039749BDE
MKAFPRHYPTEFSAKVLGGALFAFPLLMAIASHWASTIFVLVAVIAFFSMRAALSMFASRAPLRIEELLYIGIVLAYLGTTVISNTLSGWTEGSISWFEATFRFLLAIPLFLYMRAHPECVMYLLRAVPLAGIIIGSYVLAMLFIENGRIDGPYGPIVVGNMAVLLMVVSLATMQYPTYRLTWKIPIHLVGAMFALVAVVLSGTRSAWLATLIVLPMAIFMALKALPSPRLRTGILIGTMVAFGAVIMVSVLGQPKLTQERLALAVKQTTDYLSAETREQRDQASRTSIGVRLEQWRVGLLVFSDHPFFGVGVGNVGDEINQRISEGRVSPAIEVPSRRVNSNVHLHSAYIDALAFKGAIGFSALMLLLLYPAVLGLSRQMRGKRAWDLAILVMMVFAVISLTVDPFIRNGYTSIYIMFQMSALALLFSEKAMKQDSTTIHP